MPSITTNPTQLILQAGLGLLEAAFNTPDGRMPKPGSVPLNAVSRKILAKSLSRALTMRDTRNNKLLLAQLTAWIHVLDPKGLKAPDGYAYTRLTEEIQNLPLPDKVANN